MNDELDNELRAAVRSQAESVHPTDRLGTIRTRTQGGAVVQWWRRPSALAAGAALVAASVIAVAVTLADSDPGGTDTPVSPSTQREVTIYEVERVGENTWLDPEQVTTEDTGEPALDAVRALTSSDWGPCAPSGVQAVHFSRRVVTFEFEPVIDCGLSGDLYAVQAQQLAWTVRAATGSDQPVRAPGLGRTVADPGALSPVLIDSPDDGDTVTSPVRVTGTSDTFEGNVQWQVLQDDEVVDEGSTLGGTMGVRRGFRFVVDLEPGEYTVSAYELSAEDGSLFAEDKDTFTVE